jgi:hypothetical protein
MENRKLYINVNSHEIEGSRSSKGDGSRYSGFSHTVVVIDSIDCAFYCESGKGYTSHRVADDCYLEDIQSYPSEETLKNAETDTVYVVIVRYFQGDTFGKTDGHFSFPFVGLTEVEARDWAVKNEKQIRDAHTGWMSGINSISVCPVKYVHNDKNVPNRNFWDEPLNSIQSGFGNI